MQISRCLFTFHLNINQTSILFLKHLQQFRFRNYVLIRSDFDYIRKFINKMISDIIQFPELIIGNLDLNCLTRHLYTIKITLLSKICISISTKSSGWLWLTSMSVTWWWFRYTFSSLRTSAEMISMLRREISAPE